MTIYSAQTSGLTRLVAVTACWLATATAIAQAQTEISGKWRANDGSVTVNIAPCSNSADFCAAVIEEVLSPGEPSTIGSVVIKDIRKDAQKGWQGKYIEGKSVYAAQITLKDNTADFKVCTMLVMCETQSFSRVK